MKYLTSAFKTSLDEIRTHFCHTVFIIPQMRLINIEL